MSRTGSQVGQKTTSGAAKVTKRDRSPSDDATRGKKQKPSALGLGTPKTGRSTIGHVKKYLMEASDKELDRLSDFLLKRKRKQIPSTPAGTESKSDNGTRCDRPNTADQSWCREVSA